MGRGARALAAALAALILVVAPVTGAVRADCDLCPKDCPMHAAPEKAPKLGCHGAKEAPAHGAGMRLTRPPCRDHSAASGGLVQQPMLRPAAPSAHILQPGSANAARLARYAVGRAPQPEPPPPRRAL